jgi:hypothetical protein
VTYRANARREAVHQLAEVRAPLATAEGALTEAEAALKQAEARFAAADGRVAAAEDALHAAYADHEAARPERYTARQAHERPAHWWHGCSGVWASSPDGFPHAVMPGYDPELIRICVLIG